ncbi:hypothetical protein LguiA_018987 [Lonicera macranthoides]
MFAILITVMMMRMCMVDCTPPEDPIKCSSKNSNCTITNSYGSFPDRTICRAVEVKYPTTEQELIEAVATATKKKIKVKVSTRYSHSIPKLVCPDGEDGLLISTKYLNRTLRIDAENMTMTVESGLVLRELIKEAAEAGLALPYTPYWWGLSIGGLMGTGAHGSTLWGKGSSVHDYVVEVRIVTPAGPEDGYAKVRRLVDGDEELNAVKVSLGVLGRNPIFAAIFNKLEINESIKCELLKWVDSRFAIEDLGVAILFNGVAIFVVNEVDPLKHNVTLKLQPMFKRSITYITKNDSDLEDQVANFGNDHEFADLTWYPSQRKVVYRLDDRVPSNFSGDGWIDFPGFRSIPSLVLAILRTTEENQERLGDADGKCISAKLTASTLKTSAYGLTNDGISFTSYPVVGYHNRLQASGTCLDSHKDAQITACPWDHRVKGLFFHQTTISIELSKAKSFIQDVQKLVDLAPKSMCGVELYNGILMRYVTASSAYLGKQEAALDFDITYFRSSDPKSPRMYEDVLEEIEQLAVFKYGGLPHWGKNRNVAFDGAINKYKYVKKFLKVKKMYDPLGLFSSEWTDQVLGLSSKVTIMKSGCALEGLCICSQDIHCAPDKGYLCQPGKIYKDARVCTHSNNQIPVTN